MTQSSEVPLVQPEHTAQHEQNPPPTSLVERFALAIVFTVYIVFRATDRVFYKNIGNALSRTSYNLVWSNILWPFSVQIITIGLLIIYILYMRSQGNHEYSWRFFLPGNSMASSLGAVPLFQLALFSLGDQLQAAISAPPTPFVALPIQSVMTNGVLIWMALLSFFWIKARYQQVHYIGICLIMMSVMVQISAKVSTNDCSAEGMKDGNCFQSYKTATGEYIELKLGAMIVWFVMFFVSTLPGAAGNVYKQVVLQGRDVDVCYATWWSGNFQVLWGWLCIPLMWIPLPGQEVLSPGSTFSEIGYTLACIGGSDAREGDETCATSPPPWVWIILYLCFNVSFNMCLLWLTKRMSAAWAQVGQVVCSNLCGFFAQYRWAAGKSAEVMSLNDWLGLILASIALWCYSLARETNKFRPAARDDVQAGSCREKPEQSNAMIKDEPGDSKNNDDV